MSGRTHVSQDWTERAACGLSLLCLIHCLAAPVAVALLPSVAVFVSVPDALHFWLFIVIAPLSASVLISGGRNHGDIRPILFGAVGILLLGMGALLFPETATEMAVTTFGSLMLVAGHGLNWRRRHGCPAE